MAGVTDTRKNALLLVAMLFAQLLLISGRVKRAGGSTLLETGVLRASSPVLEATRTVSGGVSSVAERLHEISTARTENVLLRREVDRLRTEVGRTREAALENHRLRRLLEMREEMAPRSLGATVVAANLSGQTRMIVIDRGTGDGGSRAEEPRPGDGPRPRGRSDVAGVRPLVRRRGSGRPGGHLGQGRRVPARVHDRPGRGGGG